MLINIKILYDMTISLVVNPAITVQELKISIGAPEGIENCKQRLQFEVKVFLDFFTLHECGVSEFSLF